MATHLHTLPGPTALRKKIREITGNTADEPDLYAYIKELLTRSAFGLSLQNNQVVVDTKLSSSRKRPDLVVYRTLAGKALRGSDYAAAVFEVKSDDAIETNGKAFAKEKRGYVQSGTRWFYLADQKLYGELTRPIQRPSTRRSTRAALFRLTSSRLGLGPNLRNPRPFGLASARSRPTS